MKFCKNLQRVVEISDPEWAPYWINYKLLKKLIKSITSASSAAAPPGEVNNDINNNNNNNVASESAANTRDSQTESSGTSGALENSSERPSPAAVVEHQSQGDETSERRQTVGQQSEDSSATAQHHQHQQQPAQRQQESVVVMDTLGKSPGEVAFFKLLHSEVKKATHFFEQAQKEYAIREERVSKGMEIIQNEQCERPNGDAYHMSSADERWSRLAQSIFRLYRELLLLETFAIMSYVGFSKILKKHDKNTGFSTRNAFMAKIVNQANFVHYPQLLQMINRCEQLYEDVSGRLVQQGKNDLHEDERLFIHMIHRLNAQVVGGGSEPPESASTSKPTAESKAKSSSKGQLQLPSRTSPLSQQEAWKAQSLKQLVAENDRPQGGDDSDSDTEDAKLKATKKEGDTSTNNGVCRKRAPGSVDDHLDAKPSKVAKQEIDLNCS